MLLSSFAPSSSAHLDGTDIIWLVQENVQTGELRYPYGKPGGGRHRRDVVSDTSRLWPNGIVYYSINDNLQGQSELFNCPLLRDIIGELSETICA